MAANTKHMKQWAWDRVWIGAELATMDDVAGIGHVRDGALAIRGGRIAWLGTRAQLEAQPWSAARKGIGVGRSLPR